MTALELIQSAESSGAHFMVDGDRLGITPASAVQPMIEELRLYKFEIIKLLSQRPAMPHGVRLVNYAPATPPITLSRYETVVDTSKFIQSTLAQIDARLHDRNFLAGNWPLSGLLDRLAAVGCIVALENKKAMLQ